MKTRIISGLIAVAGLVILTIIGSVPIGILCMLATGLAIYESYRAFGLLKHRVMAIIGMIAYPLFFYLDLMIRNSHSIMVNIIFFGVCILFLLLTYPKVPFRDMGLMMLLAMLLTILISRMYVVRNLPFGQYFIWILYIGAWGTDTFAYFGGTFFGKHPFLQKISPKKTVEGAAIGIIGTTAVCLIYGIILNATGVLTAMQVSGLSMNVGWITLIGAVCGVLAQMGDFFASAIKREVEIKDFGKIMPGHGGVLDRFDSVLLVAPAISYAIYFILVLF